VPKAGINLPLHGSARSEWLLYHMPYLTRGIDDYPKHRHYQSRTTPRNRFECSNIPSNKLGPIQRYLPTLLPRYSRLFANIRYHAGKLTHLPPPPRHHTQASLAVCEESATASSKS
jgi:hypothetical protein